MPRQGDPASRRTLGAATLIAGLFATSGILDSDAVFAASLSGAAGGPITNGPHAVFTSVASFPGILLDPPWSPTLDKLAFRSADSLSVFDVARPNVAPRCVFRAGDGYVSACRWSPDGQWLLLLVRTPAEMVSGLSSLVAVATNSQAVAWLTRDADIGGFFVWAGDGNIYYWDRTSGRRRQVTPPGTWQPMTQVPLSQKPALVLV